MKLEINLPFRCPENLAPHLEKVFKGEYDVPLYGPQVILDVGANVGAFSVWAAHRFPGALIHAYEPNPDCYKYFKKNTEHLSGIILHEFGLGVAGWRPMMNGRNNLGEASLYAGSGNGITGKHVEIKDARKAPEADILKMDVEGAELEILELLTLAGRKFTAVMLEYHNNKLRRDCDLLLKDYHLIKGEVADRGRGTFCYIHKDVGGRE